jgi:hypothetical protein
MITDLKSLFGFVLPYPWKSAPIRGRFFLPAHASNSYQSINTYRSNGDMP